MTSIPYDLFAGVNGANYGMFNNTFAYCYSLQSLPNGLFDGITSAEQYMFYNTFARSGLRSLPTDANGRSTLFKNITGSANYMFGSTFANTSLTSIPYDLFAGVNGASDGMFKETFKNCYSLKNIDDGSQTSPKYIPQSFLSQITSNNYTSGSMSDMFTNTQLLDACESGYYKITRVFDNDVSPKVSCTTCPAGYAGSDTGATANTQCYANCPAKTVANAASVTPTNYAYYNGTIYQTSPCTYNIICNPQYALNQQTLTCDHVNIILQYFDRDSELSLQPDQCVYNSSFALPDMPTGRQGYIFTGWELME